MALQLSTRLFFAPRALLMSAAFYFLCQCDIAPSKAASDSVRYNIGVTAIVRVWTKDGGSHEDVGFGQIENAKSKADGLDKVSASDSSVFFLALSMLIGRFLHSSPQCQKEAVTDAIKRSLRMFGNVLGNCIYDKSFISNVSKVKPVKVCMQLYPLLLPFPLFTRQLIMHCPPTGKVLIRFDAATGIRSSNENDQCRFYSHF